MIYKRINNWFECNFGEFMFNLGENPKTATLYDSEYSSKHYSDGYMI